MQKQISGEQLEKHLEQQRKWRRFGILLLVLLLFYAMAYGANNRIRVTKYTYETNDLPVSFNDFRIVQLSDLHNKVFPEHNSSVVTELKKLEPDIIVMTGDMVDGSTHTDTGDALMFMQQMCEIAPCYYVLGNHEHRLDKAELDDFLMRVADSGVHIMNNETVQIESSTGQTFSLIGLDDNSLQANILKTLSDGADDDFQVLLAHEPQFLDTYYAEAGVNLVFSGHAHGGQWCIPFTSQGLYAPDQGLLPKYSVGIFQHENTTMYLSAGLGNSAFPLRLFNHPEIVNVTFRTVPTAS